MPKRRVDIVLFGLLLLCFSPLLFSAEEEVVVKATQGYVSLGKSMVLNLSTDSKRLTFLQLKADVLVNNEDYVDQVKLHIPAIRHQLILLLSEQSVLDMKTPAKREALRQQATSSIQDLIGRLTNNQSVEEILFSNVLVQ